jgi:phage N-6-adenine-methyltransferase
VKLTVSKHELCLVERRRGGLNRAAALSPRRRSSIARRAARARWRRRSRLAAMWTSKTAEYPTPDDFYREVDAEFHFELDAAASAGNAKCELFYTKEQDGLRQPWAPHRTWVNPPYDEHLDRWLVKAYEEAQRGATTVVMLIPARTDRAWWHEHVMGKASEVHYVKGRLKFNGLTTAAPFASAVVVFRPPAAVLNDAQRGPAHSALFRGGACLQPGAARRADGHGARGPAMNP